ncbi:MAG: NAD-dependent epimerase/dehydratase family protein [Neobacillus sp.]
MGKIKNILVTGSSGTIGTALCETLLFKGFNTFGVDIKPNRWNTEVQKKTILADLREEDQLKKLPKTIDLVIHLAANARVYDLVVDPKLARENILMLVNVIEYLRTAGIKKIIFSSSREVYGNAHKGRYAEGDTRWENCESPYSASKIGGEVFILSYHRCFDIDFVILRFSNVYGKYDNSDRVVPLFTKRAMEDKDLVIFDKGKVLDFTYIDDTVKGISLCIEKFDLVKNEVFNIATGSGITLVRVAELIKKLLLSHSRIELRNSRVGEVVRYIADISKAENSLGFKPEVGIEEGLKRSIEWYCEFYSQNG